MSYQLYRQSKLGDCLVEALDVLISNEKLTPELAMKVLGEFDHVICEMLETNVAARATFKGALDTYRFCDNVWTFVLSNPVFKVQLGSTGGYQPELRAEKVKIVCVDAKLAKEAE